MYTSIIHFLFTFVFAVMGCYVTVVIVQAFRRTASDPYNLQSGDTFTGRATNGTIIQVTADNAALCPAFQNCAQQRAWVNKNHARGLTAVVGCAAVDAML